MSLIDILELPFPMYDGLIQSQIKLKKKEKEKKTVKFVLLPKSEALKLS